MNVMTYLGVSLIPIPSMCMWSPQVCSGCAGFLLSPKPSGWGESVSIPSDTLASCAMPSVSWDRLQTHCEPGVENWLWKRKGCIFNIIFRCWNSRVIYSTMALAEIQPWVFKKELLKPDIMMTSVGSDITLYTSLITWFYIILMKIIYA